MNTSPAVLRAQARIHRLSSGGFTDRTIGFFDGARRILVEAGGTGILLFLDILFGSMSLTMSFQNGASLLGIPIGASFIAVLISASTSAVQIVLWRIIVETTDWYKKVLTILPGLVLSFLDTGLDSALSNWIVYSKSPMEFPPKNTNIMFWFVYGVIVIITGFNEPLVEIIRQRSKSKQVRQQYP